MGESGERPTTILPRPHSRALVGETPTARCTGAGPLKRLAIRLNVLRISDGKRLVVRNPPWPCVTSPTSDVAVSTFQTSMSWERLFVGHAGAGMGRTPRDSSSPSEERGNCPTAVIPGCWVAQQAAHLSRYFRTLLEPNGWATWGGGAC